MLAADTRLVRPVENLDAAVPTIFFQLVAEIIIHLLSSVSYQ
jgi:hypothetical protein